MVIMLKLSIGFVKLPNKDSLKHKMFLSSLGIETDIVCGFYICLQI